MSPKTAFSALLAAVVLLGFSIPAYSSLDTNHVYLVRAQKALSTALQTQAAATNAVEAGWQVGRAAFIAAELATNDTQCATAARIGITACRESIALKTSSAPAHYYLAVNLGKLAEAQAPSLAAYRLVYEVEREFNLAATLDVRFDHAGPARTLGELYFQAPGWPLSVGNNQKAREWLERAVALAPDYPENQLNLAEAQLKWHQRDEATATFKKIEVLWPVARTNFTGEEWEFPWLEWEARRAALRADYQKTYGHLP
jgi:tetratricopeptide (TPR) repeat protein